MNKRVLPVFTLTVSLFVLVYFIGGIGCQRGRTESDSVIMAAQEAVAGNVKRIDEQRHEKPGQLPPLEIELDNVQSQVTRIGAGGGVEGWDLFDIGGVGGGGIGGSIGGG